jgi:predicted amidohydrolase YtcJ
MANRFALVNGKVFTAAGIRYGSWPNRRDGHRCGTEPGHRTGSGYGTGPDHAIDIEALLIEGNTIAETGTTVRILEMVGGPETPAVPVVDLQGRTVIPGLVDSHNHILSTADLIEGVNCFGLKTIDELKEAVSQAAAKTEPGQWITGGGWIESQFIERRMPTRHDLDEAAPHNPVCLSRLFGMSAVNSMALNAAGIGKGFVPQAGRVDLDGTGEPTGIVRESAQGLISKVIREAMAKEQKGSVQEELERRITLALKELLKYGITSVLDPGVSGELMRAYTSLWAKQALPIRVTAMPTWHGKSVISGDYVINPAIEAGLQPGLGDQWFRVGNLKMAIDGGLGAKTAIMHEPYKDWSRSTMPARVDLNKLGSFILDSHLAGWGTGIHCCGDLAQDIAVSHMAAAISRKEPLSHQRHHIIHGYFPTEYALRAMSEHDIAISLQPGFIYVEGDIYPDALDEKTLLKFKPAKTYLARGIRVAINTDVSSGPIDPFVAIYGAVARKTIAGLDFGQEEALTPREAIQCFTEGGAYLAYREKECGALIPGRFADLAILDHDILDGGPEELLKTRVAATMLDGKFVHLTENAPKIPEEFTEVRT